MGLGKTVQAIVAALLLRRAVGAEKALVVCPASLKHQWRREIEKACGERAVVVEGPRAQRAEAYRTFQGGFLVINYELVLKDLEVLRAAEWTWSVLDEASASRTGTPRRRQAVKRLETPSPSS
jgi:SNF2 family DNA or RNA helicase